MDELIAEQIRYYRARAPEYDATSPAADDRYARIAVLAADALRALGPVGHAIELGAGTGQFTGVLATMAGRVTAVDSAPEALELNALKVPAANVERVTANVFEWRPAEPADLVVFAALLSHVPTDRLPAFMGAIERMLGPDGRAFVIDESRHGEWEEEPADDPGGETVYRTLSDGRRFRIVKVLWDPDELTERLLGLGWRARLTRVDPLYWGTLARV
jgi:2-polyprenyl-3-methyl-5-hydroxy-6-metoxy-1,4-benzoquinol methylase